MEKDLVDDCEFWLPPQFLTDDDLLMNFKKDGLNNPFGPYSDLSSPVESVVGSTETESDEDNDNYITGLTLKMAQSTLHEEKTKGLSLSGSPQSTLCGCKYGSSRGSPNGPSQASSPPLMTRPEVSMDLLYAAAGEVARIRMMEETAGLYNNNKGGGGIWASPRKTTSPVPVGPKKPNLSSLGSFSTTNQQQLSYQQLQFAQFQRLKQQQMMKQGQFRQYPLMADNRARNGVVKGTLNLPNSAWPTPTLRQSQQQPNPSSGMRAVFLGNPGGPKRECAGTGVFLPRRVGTQTETRKKPGCPVILPDRVVQALNLNLEAMDANIARPQFQVQTRCHNGDAGFTPATDGGLKHRNNMVAVQQRRNQRTQLPPAMPQELQLPQEWTY
ncbi:hypothetical protein K7X08_000434 [Anisodus acutangulus]|uniref:Uncharacterized protein n=1 Tax=Anisodus acutangulus TaxID=402998 RepID=A0A9Q1RD16_9SOLA|nr:hypothetical protein K7X08_000434 [Anisodus acutangulus]